MAQGRQYQAGMEKELSLGIALVRTADSTFPRNMAGCAPPLHLPLHQEKRGTQRPMESYGAGLREMEGFRREMGANKGFCPLEIICMTNSWNSA